MGRNYRFVHYRAATRRWSDGLSVNAVGNRHNFAGVDTFLLNTVTRNVLANANNALHPTRSPSLKQTSRPLRLPNTNTAKELGAVAIGCQRGQKACMEQHRLHDIRLELAQQAPAANGPLLRNSTPSVACQSANRNRLAHQPLAMHRQTHAAIQSAADLLQTAEPNARGAQGTRRAVQRTFQRRPGQAR